MARAVFLAACLTLLGPSQLIRAQDLGSGASLDPGKSLISPDGRFILTLQTDGNLVWLRGDKVLWHSGTHGTKDAQCRMQSDGNLTIFGNRGGKTGQVWESHSAGRPGASLACQADGNLVIHHDGKPIWASNTRSEDVPGITIKVEEDGYLTEKWTFEMDRESAEALRNLLNYLDEDEAAVGVGKLIGKITHPAVKVAVAVAGGLAYYNFKSFKAELNKKGTNGKNGITVAVWALRSPSLKAAAIHALMSRDPAAGVKYYVGGQVVAAGSALVNPKSWKVTTRP